MTEEAFARYLARAVTNYANELSRANDLTPEAARAQSEATYRRLLPEGRPDAEDQHMFTALDEAGNGVGMVWFGVRRDRKQPYAYIWDIHVESEHRGRGLGEHIMRQVEERARALGLGHVALNVFGHNMPARKLYERLGYQVAAVSMGKDL